MLLGGTKNPRCHAYMDLFTECKVRYFWGPFCWKTQDNCTFKILWGELGRRRLSRRVGKTATASSPGAAGAGTARGQGADGHCCRWAPGVSADGLSTPAPPCCRQRQGKVTAEGRQGCFHDKPSSCPLASFFFFFFNFFFLSFVRCNCQLSVTFNVMSGRYFQMKIICMQ